MSALDIVTFAEAPELVEPAGAIKQVVWPPFMFEDETANRIFDRLFADFPRFQLYLVDDDSRVVGLAQSIPWRWEPGTELPRGGWAAVLEAGVEGRAAGLAPTALAGLEIVIHPDCHGRGLGHRMVAALQNAAVAAGLGWVTVPVRPNRKPDYPLIPMERYAGWQRPDGTPFDPWLRVHWRAGARFAGVCPESMRITGTVAQWESWTGLALPSTGSYVVAGALVPVEIDVEAGTGLYLEPNVWMVHDLGREPS